MKALTENGGFVGTEALGRAFEPEEERAIQQLLRKAGFVAASLAALRFANRLTQDQDEAQDVLSRSLERLLRTGWDPEKRTLAKQLKWIALSEFRHNLRDEEAGRKREQEYLQDLADTTPSVVPAMAKRVDGTPAEPAVASYEQLAIQMSNDSEEAARQVEQEVLAVEHVEELRRIARAYGNDDALLFLDEFMAGREKPAAMAAATRRPVEIFYAAKQWLLRHARRLALKTREEREKRDSEKREERKEREEEEAPDAPQS